MKAKRGRKNQAKKKKKKNIRVYVQKNQLIIKKKN